MSPSTWRASSKPVSAAWGERPHSISTQALGIGFLSRIAPTPTMPRPLPLPGSARLISCAAIWPRHSPTEEEKMAEPDALSVVAVYPASAERWHDLETLFGERGADAGCWCMFWRIEHALYTRQTTADHKAALKEFVEGGQVPGLLLY